VEGDVSEGRTAWRIGVAAMALWMLGALVLGTRWEGIEVRPGVWRDAISLPRWVAFWAAVACVGLTAAPWVPTWRARVAALGPLLLWFAFELRAGTLAPIAWVVYATPTVVAWLASARASDLVRRRWHVS
jgi:hypothetical protein